MAVRGDSGNGLEKVEEEAKKTEELEKTKANIKEWHPAMQEDLKNLYGWDEVVERWDQADSAKEKISILHWGFTVALRDDEETVKRVYFYLETAFGYKDHSNFMPYHLYKCFPADVPTSDSKERQEIAEKAWSVLCQKFFKDKAPNDSPNSSLHYFEEPDGTKVLDKILWFFSEKDNVPRANPKDHNGTIARNFLIALAKLSLREGGVYNIHPFPRIRAKRHQFLEILWTMRKLDVAVKDWRGLTNDDLEFIHGLALRGSPMNKKPLYKNIKEAIIQYEQYAHAARIYVQLKTMLGAVSERKEFNIHI